ncbi:MAG: J domain-containing protein, partial [Alphaproteobacteria bacterium]|nr:J domain-containing protein [Alphaproteobacteria bacterium]
TRLCDHPGCQEAGDYKAPKSTSRLRDYFWFCLDHVRAYNAGWNYCEGMKQDDIDNMVKSDVCWGRPTWPLGQNGNRTKETTEDGELKPKRGFSGRIYDPFEVYEQAVPPHASGKNKGQGGFNDGTYSHPEMESFKILGFDRPANEDEVKQRYKQLAKDLHPDLNKDNPKAVERLKDVNQAYSVLKKSFSV